MDRDTVEQMWTLLEGYINTKEKQTAADHLASDLVDVMDEEDLRYLAGLDKYMKSAIMDHIGEEEFEEEYE